VAESDVARGRTFDVICAGDTSFRLSSPFSLFASAAAALRIRPDRGVVGTAIALATRGLRVGIATELTDDPLGRATVRRLMDGGVDVEGVTVRPLAGELLVARGAARGHDLVASSPTDGGASFAVPQGWSSRVLLVAGSSPLVARAASHCRAARAGRRHGAVVVVELAARWHEWAGRDVRALRSVVREADVVVCTASDLRALGLDVGALREMLRASAVLVFVDRDVTCAFAPFGQIARPVERRASAARDADVAVSVCAELARAADPADSRPELWERVLGRAACGALATL